jgi:hypothetical protein
LSSFNEKNEKPVNISNYLGKKPVFACGNVKSGGDLPMLYFTEQQNYPTMVMMVNHDDGINEFTYEDKAKESLKTARGNKWTIISIKNDWSQIFQFTQSEVGNTPKIKQVKDGDAFSN